VLIIAASLVILVPAVFCAVVIIIDLRDIDQKRMVVEAEIPNATAFLARDPAYKDVHAEVEVSGGVCILFAGTVPTEADRKRLDAELNERYQLSGFEEKHHLAGYLLVVRSSG